MEHLADAPIANILILAGVIFLAVGLFGRVGGFIGSIFGNIEAGQNSRVLAGVMGAILIVGGGWLHEEGDRAAASKSTPTSTASITGAASTATPSPAPSAGTATKADPSDPPRAPAPKVSKDTTTAKTAIPSSSLSLSRPSPSASTSAPTLAANRENLPAKAPATVPDDRLVGTWTNVVPIPPAATAIKRIEVVRVGQGLDAHFWYSCSSAECDYGIHRLKIFGDNATYDFFNGDRRLVGSIDLYAPSVMRLSVDIFQVGTSNRWHHNRVLAKSTASEKVLEGFSKYLNASGQKAWAMAPGGAWSYHIGYTSVSNSAELALQHCKERAGTDCRILMLNNEPTD